MNKLRKNYRLIGKSVGRAPSSIGLTPGSSSTVHIYTQTIHIKTHITILVGRLSGIRTQSGQTKINDELTA